MTSMMREALQDAQKHPIRRIHDVEHGQPPWPAHPASLNALVRRGYLERTVLKTASGVVQDVWSITEEGKRALRPPDIHRVESPIYMSRGSVRYKVLPSGRWAVDEETEASGDYTTDPRKSIDRDTQSRSAVPVLVRPADLDRFTAASRQREQARKRQEGECLDSKPLAERVTRLERVAKGRRTNISNDLRLVRHMLASGRDKHALQRVEQLEERLGQRAA